MRETQGKNKPIGQWSLSTNHRGWVWPMVVYMFAIVDIPPSSWNRAMGPLDGSWTFSAFLSSRFFFPARRCTLKQRSSSMCDALVAIQSTKSLFFFFFRAALQAVYSI